MKKIYVGNFSFSTTEAELRQWFEPYGAVESATVVTDRDTGRSRGFGFVEMATNSEADAAIARLLPHVDVLVITGDHSTPVPVKGHSWHPQPVMISGEIAGWDGLDRFTERAANQGSLGVFEAKHLIRLMQANAKRLDKFGA